jgi:hypothetical protein
MGVALFLAGLIAPNQANAQNPPSGYIFDLSTIHPSAFSPNSVYVQYTVSFVASAPSEYISFAFREAPAFFSFDDASVIQAGGSTNLLADPGFELSGSTVGTNFPVGWGRWIQPVDTSAIGVVAQGTNNSCSTSGPHTGSLFWCDGSVQGYDALYQQLNGLTVGATYNISFWVTDNSNAAITNPTVDMVVYAGTALPLGSQTISATPSATPAPRTLWLILLGITALGVYGAFRNGVRA